MVSSVEPGSLNLCYRGVEAVSQLSSGYTWNSGPIFWTIIGHYNHLFKKQYLPPAETLLCTHLVTGDRPNE